MSEPLTDLEAEGFIPRAQRCIGVKYGEAAMLCRMVRVGCAHACTYAELDGLIHPQARRMDTVRAMKMRVAVRVSCLRDALEDIGFGDDAIETVADGYRLNPAIRAVMLDFVRSAGRSEVRAA